MVSINYASREVSCKIVYYGPGLSGKTTNLQYVHKKVPSNTKGKLISLATDADRTLYFDFLPINIGTINGFAAKFQLYTVPGQVYYNATRKLVLRGVDGLVFVADSQPDKMDENIESLNNLKENLAEYGYSLDEIPIVIQYNKQDLPGVMTPDQIRPPLNPKGWQEFKASATEGFGVFDTLKCILKLVLEKAKSGGAVPSAVPAQAQPAQQPAPMPARQAPPPAGPAQPYEQPQFRPQQAHEPPRYAPPDSGGPSRFPQPTQSQTNEQPTMAPAAHQTQPPPSGTSAVREEYVQNPPQPEPIQPQETSPPPQQTAGKAVYRPFPGNTAEDEQFMHQKRHEQGAAMMPPGQTPEIATSQPAPETGSENKMEQQTTPTGRPRMEPSRRAEKPRKKSFFKRLFGLK